MQRFILLAVTFLTLFFSPVSKINAQDEKVDFTASWKQDSTKAIIVVNITKGNAPFTFFVYDGSPFDKGKLLSKTENITNKTFEVEMNKKMKVYVCVFKDNKNATSKWIE
jgi:hypothetical protein